MSYRIKKPTHGIEFVHNTDEELYRRIQTIPEMFSTSESIDSTNFGVEGSRELSLENKHYILNGISTCALNICLTLGNEAKDRELFIDSSAIYKFHAEYANNKLNSTEFMRALEAFECMSGDALGEGKTFIERTAHGSGNRASYRINPNVSFTDLR